MIFLKFSFFFSFFFGFLSILQEPNASLNDSNRVYLLKFILFYLLFPLRRRKTQNDFCIGNPDMSIFL